MQTERLTKYLDDILGLPNKVQFKEFSRFFQQEKLPFIVTHGVYRPVIIIFLNDDLAIPTDTLQKGAKLKNRMLT